MARVKIKLALEFSYGEMGAMGPASLQIPKTKKKPNLNRC